MNDTPVTVTVPVTVELLKRLYELACEAEYDNASGLCHHCGEAVSPAHNEPHKEDCEWLKIIDATESILEKVT